MLNSKTAERVTNKNSANRHTERRRPNCASYLTLASFFKTRLRWLLQCVAAAVASSA
jgi:hypothetical protein